MKEYDFDKPIERRGTDCLKWDALKERFGRPDLLPLWVADMDFETPSFVVDALEKRMANPVYGYTLDPKDYWDTVTQWIKNHHGWEVEREWITYIPGIVKGIGMVINVFTNPGDKVIIQPPVYHPFRFAIQGNDRVMVENPLKMQEDGTYDMDFEQLADVADGCKLLIMANPHNPGGRIWPEETLRHLADFCYDHHILVVSDEIHCDMALFGHKHHPFAHVSDKAAQCSITFGAPTKTFNMAGIVSSWAIIPNKDIRERFFKWLVANEFNEPNMLAPIATVAAFKQGEAWRKRMLAYIEQNILFVEDYCREHLPAITPLRPEASFLVWLDCRRLGLDHDHLVDLFVNKAHLALNDGEMFGRGGEGFMRLNVGTQRATLRQALDQLRDAINSQK